MFTGDNWRERFGISDGDVAQFKAQNADASDLSFLRWCLTNGKISESEYFDWAMRTFDLPLVESDFFMIPADLAFWDRVKNLGPWSPFCLPLAEWDGVMTIACLAPPTAEALQALQAFQALKQPHNFVLASARNLDFFWKTLNPQALEPSEEPAAESSAENTFASLPEGFAFTASGDEATATAYRPSDLMSHSIGSTETTDATDTADANDAHSLDVPEGFALPPPPASTIATPPAPPQHAADHLQASVASALAAVSTSADDSDSEGEENTMISVSQISSLPLDASRSLDELGTYTLVHILKHFDGAMILVSKEDETLQPWKWSDMLTSANNANLSSISLETPSIFRIVYRSQLPYHGRVAPSDINTAFFNAYFNGLLPAHATLVPVFVERKFAGMILGISNKPVAQNPGLREMESIAAKASEQIAKFKESTAA